MKVGLLWFDNDRKRELENKVGRAARHYQCKFGRQPNVCYVHPSMLDGKPRQVGNVQVAPLPSVLQHHFFVGVENERDG